MVLNNKGQVFFFTFMIGVTLIVLALALAPVLVDRTTDARNSTNLDCNNASISTFNKATCYVTDLSPFYFVAGMIFIAGAVIGARVVFQ